MSQRIIPLEPIGGEPDGPVALTDVVIALYLEGVPGHDHDGERHFDAGPLSEATVAAFALGCAMGVGNGDRMLDILEQTHAGAVEHVIEECREPLVEKAAAVRSSPEPLEPEDFIDDLLRAVEDDAHATEDTAHNALSMAFEYGCILAHVERAAAMMVRNVFNRAQAEAVAEFEAGSSDDLPPGPDPHRPLQDLAAEILSAYEADIGFGAG